MDNKKLLMEWIDTNREKFQSVSEALWEKPELSMQEYFASEQLCKLLREQGFEVQMGPAGLPTAFVATYGSGKPIIGFSSEYDALPGLSQRKDKNIKEPVAALAPGHGCGHNLIATGGIMAASALKQLIERKNLKGTIKIFGTPAEELCIGKPFMAKAGLFEGLDAVLDWHPSHLNRGGACDTNAYFNVKYHFKGVSAHGNAPWFGKSSLDGAMLMAHALEMLREHIKPGTETSATTLNYAFPDVGNSFPNVVPDKTTIWCVGRMKDAELAADVMKRVDACAKGSALATGTSVEAEVIAATHDMIPNLTLSMLFEKNLKEIGTVAYSPEDQKNAKEIQKNLNVEQTGYTGEITPAKLASQPVTDSSEYSWFAPTALLTLALAPSEEVGWHSWPICKLAGSEIGQKVSVTAAKVLAASAYDLIQNKQILEKAKAELEERLKERKYETLLPADAVPDLAINEDIMSKFR